MSTVRFIWAQIIEELELEQLEVKKSWLNILNMMEGLESRLENIYGYESYRFKRSMAGYSIDLERLRKRSLKKSKKND